MVEVNSPSNSTLCATNCSPQFLLSLGVDPFLEGRCGRVLSVAKAEDVIHTLRRHSARIEAEEGYSRPFFEDERPLPPSPTASQELKTRNAVHKEVEN